MALSMAKQFFKTIAQPAQESPMGVSLWSEEYLDAKRRDEYPEEEEEEDIEMI